MTGDLSARGELILWHGETGTGKITGAPGCCCASGRRGAYCINTPTLIPRSSSALSPTTSATLQSEMYDEEGGETAYGPDVVSIASSLGHGMWAVPPVSFYGRKDGETTPTWRRLILEDTGELLSADARMQAGQGLSRFLNVVDGLTARGCASWCS